MSARLQTRGGGGSVNPLRDALSTLVAYRDRFATAVAALAPLLELGGEEPAMEVAQLTDLKALPASTNGRKPRRRGKAPARVTTRKGQKVKAAGKRVTSQGIDAKVIAHIQELAAKGLPISTVATKTGVSAPTAKKYASGVKPAAAQSTAAAAPNGKKVWI